MTAAQGMENEGNTIVATEKRQTANPFSSYKRKTEMTDDDRTFLKQRMAQVMISDRVNKLVDGLSLSSEEMNDERTRYHLFKMKHITIKPSLRQLLVILLLLVSAASSSLYAYEASCRTIASDFVPTSISVIPDELELYVGETWQLACEVSPADASYTLTWASDNPDVASVDEYGDVTAKAPGTAIITVTTDNGLTATCTVTIPLQATAISLSPASLTMWPW